MVAKEKKRYDEQMLFLRLGIAWACRYIVESDGRCVLVWRHNDLIDLIDKENFWPAFKRINGNLIVHKDRLVSLLVQRPNSELTNVLLRAGKEIAKERMKNFHKNG